MKFFASIIILFFILTTGYNQVGINELYITPGAINPEDGCSGSTLVNTNSLFFFDNDQPYNKEWIELYNMSSCDTFDLSCYLIAGIAYNFSPNILWGAFRFPEGSVLPPQDFIIFGGNKSDVPNLDYNATYYKENYWGIYIDGYQRWYLSNDEGWIGLFDPHGNPIDVLVWSDAGPNCISHEIFDISLQTNIGCYDSVIFPKVKDIPNYQFIDISENYCGSIKSNQRTYDGSTQWKTVSPSTPGFCNDTCIYTPSPKYLIDNSTCLINNGRIEVEFNECLMEYQYFWDNNTSNTGSIYENLFAGNHFLTVIDNFGCILRNDIIYVSVDDPGINFHFNYVPDNCNLGTGSIEITDIHNGFPPYIYKWSRSENDSLDFISDIGKGSYTVSVTDQYGCTKTKSTYLDNECILIIPNTITPNNDGVNDTWELKNLEFFPDNKVEIYNRNGHLIYNTINYQNDWYGLTNDNELLPASTYYYIIYLGQYGIVKGSITIVN